MNILNEIREGSVSIKSRSTLLKRLRQPILNITDPIQLFTINKKVDDINNQKLAAIPHPSSEFYLEKYTYGAVNEDDVSENERLLQGLLNGCLAHEVLILKKTAQVMFIKNNFDMGYVNGSLGEVVGFDDETGYPYVKLASTGSVILVGHAEWKSEKVQLIKKEEDEIAFELHMQEIHGDYSGVVSKYREVGHGASIKQVPLKLAYAISCHKSQGMSLDYAKMDLGDTFVEGQGYVALSRVRSLAGISLLSFNDKAFRINPRILTIDKYLRAASAEFMKELRFGNTPEITMENVLIK
jgi:ATP-dependent exoDNAse (exonuclease V) alpha subunit